MCMRLWPLLSNLECALLMCFSYDGLSEQAWQWSRQVITQQRQVTVTSPVGDQILHLFKNAGLEVQTTWKEFDGQVRKTVDTAWINDGLEPNGQLINPRQRGPKPGCWSIPEDRGSQRALYPGIRTCECTKRFGQTLRSSGV
jgi:hypothetical protein